MSGLIVALQYRLRRTALALLWVYLAAVLVFAFGHRCGGHFTGSETHAAHETTVSRAVVADSTPHQCPACLWQASALGGIPPAQSHPLPPAARAAQLPALYERPCADVYLFLTARGPPVS